MHRGDNKHVIVLPLKKMEDSVTVAQNAQAAAADPRGNAFKTVLSRDEIENLSDDPAEMAQQLQDLAAATRRSASTVSPAAAAAEGADQIDPHRPRPVRGRKPFR